VGMPRCHGQRPLHAVAHPPRAGSVAPAPSPVNPHEPAPPRATRYVSKPADVASSLTCGTSWLRSSAARSLP
jgi:hypothetical protein